MIFTFCLQDVYILFSLFWFFVQNFLEKQFLCAEFKNDICLVIYQNYSNNHFRVLNYHLCLPRNQIKTFTCPMSQPRNQVSFEHVQFQCFVQIVIATLTDFFVLFFFQHRKGKGWKERKGNSTSMIGLGMCSQCCDRTRYFFEINSRDPFVWIGNKKLSSQCVWIHAQ